MNDIGWKVERTDLGGRCPQPSWRGPKGKYQHTTGVHSDFKREKTQRLHCLQKISCLILYAWGCKSSEEHFGEGSECVCRGIGSGGWLVVDGWAREGDALGAGGDVPHGVQELASISSGCYSLQTIRQDMGGTGQSSGTQWPESVLPALGLTNQKQQLLTASLIYSCWSFLSNS